MDFPKNILVLATHGSANMPEEYMRNVKLDERLIKNFSDFATAEILISIPEEQKVVCWFSRIVGDPNREEDALDTFRNEDFGGNIVWKNFPSSQEAEELVEAFHKKYHREIHVRIDDLQPAFIFDVHDTGNWLLGKIPEEDRMREETFPDICLSNLEGKSCKDKDLKRLAELFTKHLGITPTLNTPYKGGHVTKKYSEKCATIQIEFNRSLYMNERSQRIDKENMQKIRDGFMKVLEEFGETY